MLGKAAQDPRVRPRCLRVGVEVVQARLRVRTPGTSSAAAVSSRNAHAGIHRRARPHDAVGRLLRVDVSDHVVADPIRIDLVPEAGDHRVGVGRPDRVLAADLVGAVLVGRGAWRGDRVRPIGARREDHGGRGEDEGDAPAARVAGEESGPRLGAERRMHDRVGVLVVEEPLAGGRIVGGDLPAHPRRDLVARCVRGVGKARRDRAGHARDQDPHAGRQNDRWTWS